MLFEPTRRSFHPFLHAIHKPDKGENFDQTKHVDESCFFTSPFENHAFIILVEEAVAF